MSRATVPFKELHNWAKVYNINEALKYREVEGVLYNEGGLFNAKPDSSVSSFKAGPYSVVVDNAAKLNKEWSDLKSADEYVYKFLFKNIPKDMIVKILDTLILSRLQLLVLWMVTQCFPAPFHMEEFPLV